MLKIKIHRGTSQIGGTITEISTDKTNIFIDFGSELTVEPEKSTNQKMIDMIQQSRCDAVLFSHNHGDHIGLLDSIPQKDINGHNIMFGLGLDARKFMIRIYKIIKDDERVCEQERVQRRQVCDILCDRTRWIDYQNKSSFTIGDITVTPIRVDHSTYDAYMFLIEAEGKRIVHTGDFRAHGRLGEKLFDDVDSVIHDKDIDVLIIEGTMMARLGEKVRTEVELEEDIYKELSKIENKYSFVVCSSNNMESMASFANSAYRLGRPFIMSHYVKSQVEGYKKGPGIENKEFEFKAAHTFLPDDVAVIPYKGKLYTQMEYIKEKGFLMLVGTSDFYKEKMEAFREYNPLLIFSMWNGYLDKQSDTYVKEYGELVDSWRSNTTLHTSGHATDTDIATMIKLIAPKQGIIPVHTTNKEQFAKLNIKDINIISCKDGDEIIV